MLAALIDQRTAEMALTNLRVVPIFHDGGFATECERRGFDLNHPLWSTRVLLDDPPAVSAVHKAFVDAGSDVVSTCTYQATDISAAAAAPGLTFDGLASAAVAAAAASATGDRAEDSSKAVLVGFSLGPVGATLPAGQEFTGAYTRTREEFRTFHLPRIAAALRPSVDLLLLETFPRLDEAVAALECVEELYRSLPPSSRLPVSVSFTIRRAAKREQDPVRSLMKQPIDASMVAQALMQDSETAVTTCGGDTPEAVFAAVGRRYPFVRFVGANCSDPIDTSRWLACIARARLADVDSPYRRPEEGPSTMEQSVGDDSSATEELSAFARVPRGLCLYPNSGERFVSTEEGWSAEHLPPCEVALGGKLATHWPVWQQLLSAGLGEGAAVPILIGGCCRTYPEDIAALRAAVLRPS